MFIILIDSYLYFQQHCYIPYPILCFLVKILVCICMQYEWPIELVLYSRSTLNIQWPKKPFHSLPPFIFVFSYQLSVTQLLFVVLQGIPQLCTVMQKVYKYSESSTISNHFCMLLKDDKSPAKFIYFPKKFLHETLACTKYGIMVCSCNINSTKQIQLKFGKYGNFDYGIGK